MCANQQQNQAKDNDTFIKVLINNLRTPCHVANVIAYKEFKESLFKVLMFVCVRACVHTCVRVQGHRKQFSMVRQI